MKNTVPTSWTPLLHQSMRRGSQATSRNGPREVVAGPGSAFDGLQPLQVAAPVKNKDPTKNTQASACAPTASRKNGSGPSRKHVEPTMKSTAIHQEARCGAHRTCSRPGRVRDNREVCLRCRREDQRTVRPSGCANVTSVANGPDGPVARDHPAFRGAGILGHPGHTS